MTTEVRAHVSGDVLVSDSRAFGILPAREFASLMRQPDFAAKAPAMFKSGRLSLIIDLVPKDAV